jgi:hypothetical protein
MEERIKKLEMQVQNLQLAFDSMSRSQTTTVGRVDDTSNKVTDLTPYTETKTAYIGDTEVVFTDVPQGNLSVYFDTPTDYSVERTKDAIAVTFDALDEVTEVTISIQ